MTRFSPTRTPAPWDGVLVADKPGPACPQRPPDVSNETLALERMPKGRLEHIRRLLPYLANQSEDCLYLNLYAPLQGKHPSSPKGTRDPPCPRDLAPLTPRPLCPLCCTKHHTNQSIRPLVEGRIKFYTTHNSILIVKPKQNRVIQKSEWIWPNRRAQWSYFNIWDIYFIKNFF